MVTITKPTQYGQPQTKLLQKSKWFGLFQIHIELERGDKLENLDFNFFTTSKILKVLLTTN